jgi:hypothetical protein
MFGPDISRAVSNYSTVNKSIFSSNIDEDKSYIYPRQCNHNESITLIFKLQESTTSRCNYSFIYSLNIAKHVSTYIVILRCVGYEP